MEDVQNESSSDEEMRRVKHTESINSFETYLKNEENSESEHHILIPSEIKKGSRSKHETEQNYSFYMFLHHSLYSCFFLCENTAILIVGKLKFVNN